MLGDFEVDTYAETTFQYVSVSLLIIYVVVVTILLLNLLIAMMGDTYGNVIEGATELWYVGCLPLPLPLFLCPTPSLELSVRVTGIWSAHALCSQLRTKCLRTNAI
jgi:hypothetical protein